MQSIIFTLTFASSILFMQTTHPLAMGLTLLFQTLLISLMSGLLTKTFWFSYILFLTFLGGMLVLFIYVTSLASNEMFSLSMKTTIVIISLASIMMLFTWMMQELAPGFTSNNEMEIISTQIQLKENTIPLNKLYNFPTNLVTILMMNYLLLTLIVIVKITNIFYGPLRPMN